MQELTQSPPTTSSSTVYLHRHELDRLPPPEVFRRAGAEIIAALDFAWRPPVVLKPNVVWETAPDSGVVTHPAFVGGLVDGLLAQGLSPDEIIVAEGGGIEETHNMAEYYQTTGYVDEVGPSGVELRDLNRDESVILADSRRCIMKRFHVARTVLMALQRGTLVNVPKLKTHNMATVTLSVKNMQGMLTPIHHRHLCTRYPRTPYDNGRGLATKSVDKGVVGRDGTGFNRGTNIPTGLVLAGQHTLSLDRVGAELMGFQPREVCFLSAAEERGLIDLDAPAEVRRWVDGSWQPCPDWTRFRADPPFRLLRREDIVYDD
jgi:uncharacterized protein (DUF362 family)